MHKALPAQRTPLFGRLLYLTFFLAVLFENTDVEFCLQVCLIFIPFKLQQMHKTPFQTSYCVTDFLHSVFLYFCQNCCVFGIKRVGAENDTDENLFMSRFSFCLYFV